MAGNREWQVWEVRVTAGGGRENPTSRRRRREFHQQEKEERIPPEGGGGENFTTRRRRREFHQQEEVRESCQQEKEEEGERKEVKLCKPGMYQQHLVI